MSEVLIRCTPPAGVRSRFQAVSVKPGKDVLWTYQTEPDGERHIVGYQIITKGGYTKR